MGGDLGAPPGPRGDSRRGAARELAWTQRTGARSREGATQKRDPGTAGARPARGGPGGRGAEEWKGGGGSSSRVRRCRCRRLVRCSGVPGQRPPRGSGAEAGAPSPWPSEGTAPSPAGTHAGPARGRGRVPGCGAGGGRQKARRKRERRGESSGERPPLCGGLAGAPGPWASPGRGCGRSWGSWPRRRSGTEPSRRRCGTRQRRAGPSPALPGGSSRYRRGPADPLARGRRRCGGPSRPAGPPGAGAEPGHGPPSTLPRSTAEAAWAPHGLSARAGRSPPGPLRPRRPPPGPGPAPVSRGSARTRGRLRPGEGVCRCGKPRFRPFDPKSAPRPPDLRSPRPYLCDELLGAKRAAAGQSARLPPRFSLCGGFHGCELCNETGGLLPLPRPRVGTTGPAPGTARFPGRPKVPVPVGDPVTPRSPPHPTTVSPSPGRPEHGPNAETAGGSGGRASRPPGRAPAPASPRTDPTAGPDRTLSPGRGIPQPGRAVGTAGQGRARPGAPFHASSLRAWTPPRTVRAPGPGFPIRPAVRFGSGFLPARSHSPAGRENDSLHLWLNGAGTSLGVNLRPPPGRCRAVPAERARTRGPRGTAGPRRPPALPGAGGQPGRRHVAFSFPSSSGEAGRQRPAPCCGTCTPRGRGPPGQDRPPRPGDRGRARRRGHTRSCGHAWSRCRWDRAARFSHLFLSGHRAAVRPDPRHPPGAAGAAAGGAAGAAAVRSAGVPGAGKAALSGCPGSGVPAGPLLPTPGSSGIPARGSFRVDVFDIEFRPGQGFPGASGGADAQGWRGEAACPRGHGSGPADPGRAPGTAAASSPETGGAGGAVEGSSAVPDPAAAGRGQREGEAAGHRSARVRSGPRFPPRRSAPPPLPSARPRAFPPSPSSSCRATPRPGLGARRCSHSSGARDGAAATALGPLRDTLHGASAPGDPPRGSRARERRGGAVLKDSSGPADRSGRGRLPPSGAARFGPRGRARGAAGAAAGAARARPHGAARRDDASRRGPRRPD
ncbi:collagen alpha-1(I) chain-like [Haliaeetus albicilla]|uniref:collagen alpha-1(I) chain-like n=1 Tax=Haliaeetus albicilla TaxID=8969 RepID=UPI0037E7D732